MLIWRLAGISIHIEALAWLIGATIGIYNSWRLRQDVVAAQRAVERDGRNGAWKQFNHIRIRVPNGLLTISSAFALIGLYAFINAMTIDAQSADYDLSRIFLNGCFFFAEYKVVSWAAKDRREWREWIEDVLGRLQAAQEAQRTQRRRRATDQVEMMEERGGQDA